MKDRAVFTFIVALHLFVVLGNALAFFVLPFKADWYVALPCCSIIFFLALAREFECPLTRMENRYRRRLGMPTIKAFVRHYIVKPIRDSRQKME